MKFQESVCTIVQFKDLEYSCGSEFFFQSSFFLNKCAPINLKIGEGEDFIVNTLKMKKTRSVSNYCLYVQCNFIWLYMVLKKLMFLAFNVMNL
jgi:hypothetical protein